MNEKRLALLIGNSNYQVAGKLKNPRNDVDLIAEVLKKLGFKTKAVKDVTRKKFLIALNIFGQELDDYDLGFFFFAGHGIQVNGENYLLPIDADPKNENEVEYDCINAQRILRKMENAQSKTNIMVLDACRNNPFTKSWSRSPSMQGLTYMSAPYGSLIAYSTAPNKVAEDGIGKNSSYSEVLAEEMLAPNMTIIQVLQKVRNRLIKKLSGKQVPWESTSMLEDLVLNDGRYTSFKTLCQAIQYNKDNDYILNNLRLSIKDFKVKENINHATDSEGKKIIETLVAIGFNFENFNNLLVTKYDNGEREFNFSFKSKKVDEILSISRRLINLLGLGYYDDENQVYFANEEDVKSLVKGKLKNMNTCFTMWMFDTVNFILSYTNGHNILIFKIHTKSYKEVIKGNLLSVLKNDYDYIPDDNLKVNIIETDSVHYTDYDLMLDNKEFDFFDKATMRIFYNKNGDVSSKKIFLKNSDKSSLNVSKVSQIVSKLVAIYGKDEAGMGYLNGVEAKELTNNEFWLGRRWYLNDQHQEWDSKNAIEKMAYGIFLTHENDPDDEDYGLQLDITGYNSLLKHAKALYES
ncbi:hypothetical protein BKI52_43070 [marine bacterium AO1-C]|nr:hypothetical protein BKI52_43070 [marine bacterium AO1-C]